MAFPCMPDCSHDLASTYLLPRKDIDGAAVGIGRENPETIAQQHFRKSH